MVYEQRAPLAKDRVDHRAADLRLALLRVARENPEVLGFSGGVGNHQTSDAKVEQARDVVETALVYVLFGMAGHQELAKVGKRGGARGPSVELGGTRKGRRRRVVQIGWWSRPRQVGGVERRVFGEARLGARRVACLHVGGFAGGLLGGGLVRHVLLQLGVEVCTACQT